MTNWLRAQPDQPADDRRAAALLDRFVDMYNQRAPAPLPAPLQPPPPSLYNDPPAKPGPSRPTPTTPASDVRHDRVDTGRQPSPSASPAKLRHIGIGRTHKAPSTQTRTTKHEPRNDEHPNPHFVGSGVADVLRHHIGSGGRI